MHSQRRPDIVPFFAVLFVMSSVAACGTSSAPKPGTESSGEPPAAISASTSGTRVAPEPSGPPPVCTGDCYVLLKPTAVLRVRPAADAPTLAQGPDDRELPGRRRIPLRHVGEKDGWVEVETLSDRGGAYHDNDRVYAAETGEPLDLDEHCYEGAVLADRGLGVHLYVQRDDLEAVTTRPVRVEFPDRTAVALAPGVAVEPLASREDSSLARLVGKPALRASLDLEKSAEDAGEDTARQPALRAGAPLYWKDGQSAGRTLDEVPLDLEPGATGERQCRRFERESRTRGRVGLLSARSEDEPPVTAQAG